MNQAGHYFIIIIIIINKYSYMNGNDRFIYGDNISCVLMH